MWNLSSKVVLLSPVTVDILAPDDSLLWAAVLCFVGCSIASLTSPHEMPAALPVHRRNNHKHVQTRPDVLPYTERIKSVSKRMVAKINIRLISIKRLSIKMIGPMREDERRFALGLIWSKAVTGTVTLEQRPGRSEGASHED